jgi:hypothetical protein
LTIESGVGAQSKSSGLSGAEATTPRDSTSRLSWHPAKHATHGIVPVRQSALSP